MIASISGTVAVVGTEAAVVEVGGVGLALRAGEPVRLSTALVVREDSLTLFGFASDDERLVFETLQSVSGVGPKLAQAVLAVHSPDAIRAAVATDDIGALTLVPGVGRKGAQRLVLELKDKLGRSSISVPSPSPASGVAPVGQWRDQLRAALSGLGWTGREVDEALAAVGPEAEAAIAVGDDPDVASLLRASLRVLSRA
jgi:holliday junction DNA helicase RuvA